MRGSQQMSNLDFFWREQRGVTDADWSHLLHYNRRQVGYDFDLGNVLQGGEKMNETALFKNKTRDGGMLRFHASGFVEKACEALVRAGLFVTLYIYICTWSKISFVYWAQLTGLGVKWKLERASNLRKSASISFWISTCAGFSSSSVFCWIDRRHQWMQRLWRVVFMAGTVKTR